jgi:uncharacterized membrane protein YciS (DUF1049 family)
MQLTERHIDDFKAERKDVTPPLPMVLRLVPILFFCSIAVSVIFTSIFFLQLQISTRKRDDHRAQAASLTAQTQETRNQRTALEAQINKATDAKKWVASSLPLQPLLVEIVRSMSPKVSIVDLRLDRAADDPSQIKLAIKMNTDSTKQLDLTMDKISALEYRAISPTRELGRGELDYRATLVRNTAETSGDKAPKSP